MYFPTNEPSNRRNRHRAHHQDQSMLDEEVALGETKTKIRHCSVYQAERLCKKEGIVRHDSNLKHVEVQYEKLSTKQKRNKVKNIYN